MTQIGRDGVHRLSRALDETTRFPMCQGVVVTNQMRREVDDHSCTTVTALALEPCRCDLAIQVVHLRRNNAETPVSIPTKGNRESLARDVPVTGSACAEGPPADHGASEEPPGSGLQFCVDWTQSEEELEPLSDDEPGVLLDVVESDVPEDELLEVSDESDDFVSVPVLPLLP